MLLGIALIYIVLCLRLRIRLEIGFADGRGSAVLCTGLFGVYLRRDFVIKMGKTGFGIRAVPRYGAEKKEKKKKPVSEYMGRYMKAYAISALRSGRFSHLTIHARLGLGDACATAIAAGAAHAVVCSLLAAWDDLQVCDLRITPDFEQLCLCAHIMGIFSCSAGDIIFAALKAALRKRKEGLIWTNIPLRA